jgi:hypothetical protein
VAGCCECGDEPSGFCATELVSSIAEVNTHYTCIYVSLVINNFAFMMIVLTCERIK